MKNKKFFILFTWKTKKFSIPQNQKDFKETGSFEGKKIFCPLNFKGII